MPKLVWNKIVSTKLWSLDIVPTQKVPEVQTLLQDKTDDDLSKNLGPKLV